MASAEPLVLALWTASVLAGALCCPEPCSCSDKYGRHFAECSFRDLAEVPAGFPPNVTTLSLSANRIGSVPAAGFRGAAGATSLWLAHNRIVLIEPGALAPLLHLRNLDVSHNRLAAFPWEDLRNLTALHLLKMNHNRLSRLPPDAFSTLRELHSLRLNNNRLATVAQGAFDGLPSLSHLQIDGNPFACTCALDWMRDWISVTAVSVPDRSSITCASPERLKGEAIENLPESECSSPNATVRAEPDVRRAPAREGGRLELTCDFGGNPEPLVVWTVETGGLKRELAPGFTDAVQVFGNGTLLISKLRREDGGRYSCSATNEVGRGEDSVEVEVTAATPPPPAGTTGSARHAADRPSVLDLVRLNDSKRKDATNQTPADRLSSEEEEEEEEEEEAGLPPVASECGATANTRYVSSRAPNGSLEDVRQFTFDFGVMALGVTQTEATVRLNSLLAPGARSARRHEEDDRPSSESEERRRRRRLPPSARGGRSNGLYLCVSADRRHSAVQWSRIKEGVNTYVFGGLRPGTNYSLCLTYRGRDCEVQVLFATRRRVPNLLVIVSVSICLLTVSTVPLLGATCFHLVYKYRSKTYKLILKAKDQYHMDRSLAASFSLHAGHAESQRNISGSRLDEEEAEAGSADGDREADTEESLVTESLSLCRGADADDAEAGSQCSDRLPPGAPGAEALGGLGAAGPRDAPQ